jgi:hypothetical protein
MNVMMVTTAARLENDEFIISGLAGLRPSLRADGRVHVSQFRDRLLLVLGYGYNCSSSPGASCALQAVGFLT